MRPIRFAAFFAMPLVLLSQFAPAPAPAQTAPVARPTLVASSAVSPRPLLRPSSTAPAPALAPTEVQSGNLGFQQWMQGFRGRAQAQGVRKSTLDATLGGIRYDTNVIARDRNQAEFSKALWEYLDSAVSQTRIANGRRMLQRYPTLLNAIEQRYGVDKEVVVAIWGLESAYGSNRGSTRIIPALATLAYDGRRGEFFEEQLIAALKIVQAGDVSPSGMRGSWAGAMGHTQFMPTSFLDYAVDFRNDGKRDIWSDDPTDALASTAAYLSKFGWRKNQPWGVEVRLPQGFDYELAGHDRKRAVGEWTRMGVRGINGQKVQNRGRASILLPAGARGPAFMIFRNFNVIEAYNGADSYVIAVGHLSDRLKGKGPFVSPWPRGDRPLKSSEKKELQQRLTQAGFSTQGVDGRIGPNTIAAIKRYQKAVGMVPDGYASREVLSRLR